MEDERKQIFPFSFFFSFFTLEVNLTQNYFGRSQMQARYWFSNERASTLPGGLLKTERSGRTPSLDLTGTNNSPGRADAAELEEYT